MATQKQIDANRRNAQKSTGPKTEKGKLRSRMNSLKHGLGAIHVPLPHENLTEYHELRQGLVDTYEPANTQEQMLVDNIASAYLRMQRASRFEAALMNGHLLQTKNHYGKSLDPVPSDDFGIIVAMAAEHLEQAWLMLERYEKRATSAYYRAIEMLRKVQNDRKREPGRELREHLEQERYLKRTVAPTSASFSDTAGKARTTNRQHPKIVPDPCADFSLSPRSSSPERQSPHPTSLAG